MKQHPILFSSPMVRAILEGKKSMTRRVVILGKNCHFGATGNGKHHDYDWSRAEVRNNAVIELISGGTVHIPRLHVPFCHKGDGWEENPADDTVDRLYPIYQVGDVLWVREEWATSSIYDKLPPRDIRVNGVLWFTADGPKPEHLGRTRRSFHMPRWACRLELVVTAVRVERLQDISKADCIAEGMPGLEDVHAGWHQSYAQLWDALNSKRGYSWESNPYVLVISFEKVEAPTP